MAPNTTSKRPRQLGWEDLIAPCGKHQESLSSNISKEKEEELNKIENNEIELGTYSAAVPPLLALGFGACCGKYAFSDFIEDPRVKGWFLIDNEIGMVIISLSYIFFSMTWGPRLMKGRQPMQLKNVMIGYNAFQVIFSFYMFIETGLCGWFFDYNFRCQPCDYSYDDKPVRMTKVAHLYFLSKILDFADTVLFILRGKFSQVTNLHVIHHSCMFMFMWYGLHHTPGGHITFMGYLNTFVHTVMYSYYLLAAMGPRVRPYLWWKKYLTKLQLTQFVLIFIHTAQVLVFPCKGVPPSLAIWTLMYSFLFFALFINFYVKAYLFGSRKSKTDPPTTNGVHKNGSARSSIVTSEAITTEDSNGNITKIVEKTLKYRASNGIVSH